jgi:hypothetical protein
MVWSAENGHRTCQYCLSRDGLVVEDANIRDHPQGRCTLVPTLRSQVKYKGTLEPDGSVTMDPRWAGQKVAGAKAKASAGPTTAAQRDPLSGKRNPAAPSVAQPAQQVAVDTGKQQLPTVGADGFRRGGLPVPPQSAMDALKPGNKRLIGQYAKDKMNNTRKAMHATPDGAKLEKTLTSFQQGGARGIPALRTDIEKYLTGDSSGLVAGRIETIQRLLGAVNNSPVPNGKRLFRGMSIPGSADDVATRYAVGTRVDMSLGSFSTNRTMAEGFARDPAGKKVNTKNNTPVIIEYVGEDRHALPMENLGGNRFGEEREWVAAGQFEVESVRKVWAMAKQTVVVKMRQVGTW